MISSVMATGLLFHSLVVGGSQLIERPDRVIFAERLCHDLTCHTICSSSSALRSPLFIIAWRVFFCVCTGMDGQVALLYLSVFEVVSAPVTEKKSKSNAKLSYT